MWIEIKIKKINVKHFLCDFEKSISISISVCVFENITNNFFLT